MLSAPLEAAVGSLILANLAFHTITYSAPCRDEGLRMGGLQNRVLTLGRNRPELRADVDARAPTP